MIWTQRSYPGDNPGVAGSWSARRGGLVLHVVRETSGRLSWTVRRRHWRWIADWVTCEPGRDLAFARAQAEAAADLHPIHNERWTRRDDGILILEGTK